MKQDALYHLTLAVAGIVVSSLALAQRFYGVPASPLQHPDWDQWYWDSASVNQSSYAQVHGIPLAVLGIIGYALVALFALWRRTVLTVYLSGMGLAYAVYLTDIEAHILHAWSWYHVSSLILIVLILFLAFGTLLSERTAVADQSPKAS